MDCSEEGQKSKTLAVFKNVITEDKPKRKFFRSNTNSDEDISDSELVIVDELKEESVKRKKYGVRLKEEPLNMKCLWNSCNKLFSDSEKFYNHLIEHYETETDLFCKWLDCPYADTIESAQIFKKHITYHGYITKLVNIGENVLARNTLPDCQVNSCYTIDVKKDNYVCLWEDCNHGCVTVQDFYGHVECHARGAPTGRKKKETGVIMCHWQLCRLKFSTRYRLSDHLRVHTGERIIACPTCYSQFATKTTFCDHRKRQLKSYMRSFQCSQCLKLFSSERILSDHMRSHINQYKCTLCDMTSPKPSMLAKHYRYKHMNVRSYCCSFCDKTFVEKCNLNTHLLTHKEKPFKCDECDFGCKSKVGLTNHKIKKHGKDSFQYECQACKLQFLRGSYLTKHLMTFHKFQWPSGHSRFRYRKDSDGVFRLQTVRYESLEVTEEMIKSESMKPKLKTTSSTNNSTCDDDRNACQLTVVPEESNSIKCVDNVDIIKASDVKNREVIITIEDVDENGEIIKTEEIKISEIVLMQPG
ncbi:histone H4 transcription factor-like [Rhynchophorus ferrugineus]